MGRPEITQDLFAQDSKTELDTPTSVHSVGDVTPNSALESTAQFLGSEASPDEQQWRPDVRAWLVFICIVILAMMDAFDATVLIPVLPELANAFDKPLTSTFWASTAYLTVSAASQLFFTMICEVFSHGSVWIVAVLCSTIGTGICSGSSNLEELIVGRSIQGIGGGGAMSICFVMMSESAPESIHSRYSCYILLTRLIGTIVGPIIGGVFVDLAHWTWAFYFNYIFCALALLTIPFAVDLRVSKNIPLRKLCILDWAGASMAFCGPTAILIGLGWGGISYDWNQWQTFVPIVTGIGVLMALAFHESKWAVLPQFGSRAFRNRTIVMTYVGCFCHGFVVFAQLQFFTLFFRSTKYFSASITGVALLSITGLALTPAALVGITLAKDFRCSKWIVSSGWILITFTSVCSIALSSSTPTVGWIFHFFSAGLGHGLLLSSYNIRIQNVPKNEDTAFATRPITFSNFMRAWGMAAAVPVGGVVFLNTFGDEVHSMGLHRDLINTARGYIVLMGQVKVTEGQRRAIQDASALGFQSVWWVIMTIAAVGGVSSAFLWKRRPGEP